MDEISRGIATAALTLQSVLLQALVAKAVLTKAEAVGIADSALASATDDRRNPAEDAAARVAVTYLAQIRKGVAGMRSR